MLQKQLENILTTESLLFFRKHEQEIVDILLFGSAVKGKELPKDIDILLLFKKKVDFALEQEFRKKMSSKIKIPIEITGKTYAGLFKKEFLAREAFLTEAYSLINETFVAEGLGYKMMVLFIYELKGKTKSERMRFYYSLYGRKTEGILKMLGAQKYTETAILCPIPTLEKMKDYFQSWNIKFRETPLLIPERYVF